MGPTASAPPANGRSRISSNSWVSLGLVGGLLGLVVGAYSQVVVPLSGLQQRVESISEDIVEIRHSLDKNSTAQDRELDRVRSKLDEMVRSVVGLEVRMKALEK